MNIDEFSIPSTAEYSRIIFGIVPFTNPDPGHGIVFLLQIESNNHEYPLLKYRNPYGINTISLNEYITFENSHEFLLEIKNQYLSLIVDDIELSEKFSLPDEPTYFWIGYEAQDGCVLFATISEIELLQ